STGSLPAGRSVGTVTGTSGVSPTLWIQRLFGVSHFSTVSFTPPTWPRSYHSWTVPLPNDVSPISCARPRSCSAPATISAADAVPLSIRTTTLIEGSVDPAGLGVGLGLVAL